MARAISPFKHTSLLSRGDRLSVGTVTLYTIGVALRAETPLARVAAASTRFWELIYIALLVMVGIGLGEC